MNYLVKLRDDRTVTVAGTEFRAGRDGAPGSHCSLRQYAVVLLADGTLALGDELPQGTSSTLVKADDTPAKEAAQAAARKKLAAVLGREPTEEEWERFVKAEGQ